VSAARSYHMDHVLSAALLAASSNIDNLGVAVAYGIRHRAIRISTNLLIALVSGGGTLASMAAGESGLGAGISHVSIPLTTALTVGLSVTAIVVGQLAGSHASGAISKRQLGITSGAIIVAVGVYEYFV